MYKKRNLIFLVFFCVVVTLVGCDGSKKNSNHIHSNHVASKGINNYVTINGIQLHYMDWGGSGETILFLAGRGDTAHIFSDIAPQFTNRFRVLALTRRGFGESDQPASGYDVDQLVSDIKGLLDYLRVERTILVGHSIAGNELTRMAVKYPDKVKSLIYLDAGWNYASQMLVKPDMEDNDWDESNLLPLFEPELGPEDMISYEAAKKYFKKITGVWSNAFEENFKKTIIINPDGSVEPKTSPEIDELFGEEAYSYNAELDKIKSPVLAIYAIPGTIYHIFPWITDQLTGKTQEIATLMLHQEQSSKQMWAKQFHSLVPQAKIELLPNAVHYCFIQQPNKVVSIMKDFLAVN